MLFAEIAAMCDVFGTTSDGFSYTGQYDPAASNSVIWAARFRKDGIYRGMRHGRVFDMGQLSEVDINIAVMDDIEETWVNEH